MTSTSTYPQLPTATALLLLFSLQDQTIMSSNPRQLVVFDFDWFFQLSSRLYGLSVLT